MQKEYSNQEVLKQFGQRVKARRIEMLMDQASLSYESGVARRTLIRLETGHSVAFEHVIKVIRALGLMENFNALIPICIDDKTPTGRLKKNAKLRQRSSKADKRKHQEPETWSGFDADVDFESNKISEGA